jgi:ATP-dependent helicase YprA (DUF1998 family)
MTTATIKETFEGLHKTLQSYIEAAYHIADPGVVAQRRRLLDAAGGIFQIPFLESTPRYLSGPAYVEMAELPEAAREAYIRLADPAAGKPLIFDPPYKHQAEAIEAIVTDRKNLMIMTGTGSGKTESFLLPILGKLAIEARDRSDQFRDHPAIRAMVLYPMNALVNDQLGRLRLLFGDPQVVAMFQAWSGRPARFARYTSRTPYAGVRASGKDGTRLKSIREFFVEIEEAAERYRLAPLSGVEDDARAAALMTRLGKKGKWPSKPSVAEWFGSGHWKDRHDAYRRAVTLADDAELMTRHEVQASPPDILITNYSMLEYMMLRPVERPIFDRTRAWLDACPDEKFLIVLDEAHLYRGAQGAEVGLLLRRLRERLNLPAERFQVICATASFSTEGKAKAGEFGAQLSGASPESFAIVTGDFKTRAHDAPGDTTDLAALNAVDLDGVFSDRPDQQAAAVASFLRFRDVAPSDNLDADLYKALDVYPPFSRLVNETMRSALAFAEIGRKLFPEPDADSSQVDKAISVLMALGSRAKAKPDEASLLPCRVHAFFRGLPGLWACMDPQCSALPAPERGSPIGKLYAQPRERCACNAPVLQYFTCRSCGASYARAYTKSIDHPDHLFAEPGQTMLAAEGFISPFAKLDLLLEPPSSAAQGIIARYDLVTGRLDLEGATHTRAVYLPPRLGGLTPPTPEEESDDDAPEDGEAPERGLFVPCGCCNRTMRNRSTVQDHLTKGDQPFQALLSAQLKVQPPNGEPISDFAPLQGRKVLVFSDSRQVAARLAPTLQSYSLRDTIRALVPAGYRMLADNPQTRAGLVLDRACLAAVVAAHRFKVRLRPELNASETMPRLSDTKPGELPDADAWSTLLNEKPPANLIDAVANVLKDNILGLEALAIGSLTEASGITARLRALPNLAGLAETPESKLAVVRAWIRAWSRQSGIWFRDMPDHWWRTKVRPHKGDFTAMKFVLSTAALKKEFKKSWLPILLPALTEEAEGSHRMVARHLSLDLDGGWRRCSRCTSVHRPIPTVSACIDCGADAAHPFDPNQDPVFRARKAFYRDPVIEALSADQPNLMSLIAAEHTAQLNAARADEAFSRAEDHEMRFQDIDLNWRSTSVPETSIDVLSSTTTMEVGIDIGELSGVALRNMPPGRANYQQRSGRAGRRGNAVASVVAFGSADSHDDHYFARPQEMIRGEVVDPRLTLENPEIAKRHIRAFVLQRYHEARLPDVADASGRDASLFSVLGDVRSFRDGDGPLNRHDLGEWLGSQHADLVAAIERWLPSQLSPADRGELLADFADDLLQAVDNALTGKAKDAAPASTGEDGENNEEASEDTTEAEEEAQDRPERELDPEPDNDGLVDASSDNLLDRLLYWGVLPRYAFPTDVAPFYVFHPQSGGYRPHIEFAPSQGLNVALSQYAPNKQIWIKSKQYISKAIYSPFPGARKEAWGRRRLYFECSHCGHAKTESEFDPAERGHLRDCEACRSQDTFGPAKFWLRPPGFAHPWGTLALSTPDEPAETAYATRAKLVMTSGGPEMGEEINPRLRALATRQHLLVSNSGPGGKGYIYCARCGRIESVSEPEQNLHQRHSLPFPNNREGQCEGAVRFGIVLGADFPTDIALFSLRLDAPFRLPPANSETASAMRTVCEALAKAGARLLDIEPGEMLAEYRPALNAEGAAGRLVEVFLYDTLAGGAGFSPQLASRGAELFCEALGILERCPEGCDASCYRCLRSFRNRLDHGQLDRHLGAQLVRHVLYGGAAPYPVERAARSLDILARELERKFAGGFSVERHLMPPRPPAPLVMRNRTTGAELLIDVHSPITPNEPVFGTNSGSFIVLNDFTLRRHLGDAVVRVAERL